MKSKLTIEQVRKALDLDPATGILVWAIPQSNRIKVGDRAGVIGKNGRRYISVHSEKLMAHRLVWAHYYGVWPRGDVKQKDGNFDNCAIENLVEQTRQETASNRRVNAKSKSGHAGVTWDSSRERWQVHITRDYKQVGVGSYDRLEDAIEARREAMTAGGVVVSSDEKAKAAHAVARRRRQRMAWQRLERSGLRVAWPSLDDFCHDIGDVPETQMAIVPIDFGAPVGPGNWKWSLPATEKHDFRTREGRIAYNRAHRRDNADLYRDKELRRNFGITLVQYREKLAEQGGVCAICGSDEVAERKGKKLKLAVDHDHDTDVVRGILCIACNTGIGKLNDSPARLRDAAVYLEVHGKSEAAKPSAFNQAITAAMAASPHRDWLHVATLGFGA
jgi:Recombination endonuclease VII/HNH endonuclease